MPSNAQILATQPFSSLDETNSSPILTWEAASGYTSSTAVAQPGEGFWLVNKQLENQVVFLSGEVVLAPSNTALLQPGLNLVGYPYSSALPLNQTALGALTSSVQILNADATTPVPDENVLGKGYWVKSLSEKCIVWTEVRPYENVFPESGLPEITAVTTKDGACVAISIACEGDEFFDIFYQDVEPTNRFDAARNWKVAEFGVEARGRNQVEWLDTGSETRASPGQVLGRYFLIGRADVDMNRNGIPDAREQFAGGGSAVTETTASGSLLVSGALAEGALTQSTNRVEYAALTNREPVQVVSVGRVIYVDQRIGNDSFSGRRSVAVSQDGPKRTIRAGLDGMDCGGRVFIRSGTYPENLDVVGRDVQVNIDGRVVLTGPTPIETVKGAPPAGASTNR